MEGLRQRRNFITGDSTLKDVISVPAELVPVRKISVSLPESGSRKTQ